MTVPPHALGAALGWAMAGLAFGLAYFAALHHSVGLYAGRRGRLLPAALTVGRIAAAIAFFGIAVRFGAMALIAGFAGFVLARTVALRWVRGMG
jgi:F1-F0 ATPase (N-ATPase) AtpR subunit